MTLAGTKFREWKRSLEASRRKARDVHHAICERHPGNKPLQQAAWGAVAALDNIIGMVGAIVDDYRDARGKRPEMTDEI